MSKYIYSLDDFVINNKICIEINYNIEYAQIPTNTITFNLDKDLGNIINTYSIEENGMLLLIDVNKLSSNGNSNNVDVFKIKKIINHLSNNYYLYIDKCLFFNVPRLFKPIITLIRFTLGKKYKDKIKIQENLSKLIR